MRAADEEWRRGHRWEGSEKGCDRRGMTLFIMNSRFRARNRNVSLETRWYETDGVLEHHGECREMQEELDIGSEGGSRH